MADPKLNALVFCKKAVFTEPWWNIVGEFSELMSRQGEAYEFNMFLKLGSTTPDSRMNVRLRLVEPERLEVTEEDERSMWSDRDSIATSVFDFRTQFRREGRYHVEVEVDGELIDTVILPVVLL